MVQRMVLIAMAVAALVAGGCQSTSPGPDRLPAAKATPEDDPAAEQPSADDAARAMAQRLALAGSARTTPEILWLTPDVARDARPAVPVIAAMAPPPPAADPVPVLDAPPAVEPAPDAAPSNPAVMAPSRQELLDLLLTDLRRSNDPAMQRAIQAATLSAIDPRYQLDESILASLPADRRDAVRQYHDLLRTLHQGLVSGGRGVDRDQLAEELYDVLGPMPIDIADLQLCTRVQGFGVYNAFPDSRFIAGRAQRMILYAELEHYTSKPTDGGGFEVALTQEVELYDDAGLLVWKQDPVTITDRSAKRRRDFFTVQMIELPARLTVGKFALKVRVIDDATGNRAERSTDIEIVADPALVRSR